MNTQELIDTATQQIKSQSGYSYNGDILADVCKAGWDGLDNGTILASDGNQLVSIDKTRDVLSICKDGAEVNTQPLTAELKDKAVVVTAIKQSRLGVHVGV